MTDSNLSDAYCQAESEIAAAPPADRCDICGATMEHLTGPEAWLDTTECTACGWSPDDAWRVGA